MALRMHDSTNCFGYFVSCAYLIISESLANYSKLQAFGEHTIIDPTCSTKVMHIFSIRFWNGDVVELSPDYDANDLFVAFRLADGSFPDGGWFLCLFHL